MFGATSNCQMILSDTIQAELLVIASQLMDFYIIQIFQPKVQSGTWIHLQNITTKLNNNRSKNDDKKKNINLIK